MIGSDSSKQKKGQVTVNQLNTISHGTTIEGSITTDSDIRIEGKVIGIIKCGAKVVIGEQGSVEGYLDAKNAIISGNVKGDVIVHELLQLSESGSVNGDIYTQKLSVQIGAMFTGNCNMGNNVSELSKDVREKVENKSKKPELPHINGNGKAKINGAKNDVVSEAAKIVNEQRK